MSIQKPRSLAWLLMQQIFLLMLPLLLLGAWGVYFGMRISYRAQSLEVVRKYNADRVRVEEKAFELIQKNHAILTRAYLETLDRWKKMDPRPEFKRRMELYPDRSWRTKQQGYDGSREAGAWLNSPEPTLEEMRQILAETDVCNHFGPAFLPNFVDTFFVGRKGSMTVYWPEFPDWIHSLSANFDFTAEQYYQISTAALNPSRQMALTGLYLDRISNVWLVSAVTPIEVNGQHLTSVGHDLRVNEIIARTGAEFFPGTENMILRTDGRIVVYGAAMENMRRLGRSVGVGEFADPILSEIFDHVKVMSEKQVVRPLADDSYMIANRLAGTDWIYITRVPLASLENTPNWMLNFSLIQSFLVVLLMMIGVLWVLRRRILHPMAAILDITRRIGDGDYRWQKPRFKDLELNQLVDSMKSMTEAIEDRDRRLLSYSNHLEALVDERTKQITRDQARMIQAAKMATLGEMAGSIAHEINNPLASIELSAVSMQRKIRAGDPGDAKFVEGLAGIQKMTARMAKIVKGLRQYSRDSSADPKEPAQIRAIIEDSVVLCQSRLSRADIDLKTTYYLPADQQINCRAVEISQVLVNLIGNSVDAICDLPERWIKLDVWLENGGSAICIGITDSGPRMPKEVAEQIMTPFFTTKPVGQGTGLGLSISRSLIESHGGTLRLDHESPHTRFEIHLPI